MSVSMVAYGNYSSEKSKNASLQIEIAERPRWHTKHY